MPLATVGAWMLRARPIAGTVVIFVASVVSSLSGIEYGGVDILLPTLVALYFLGRAKTPWPLDLAIVIGFIAATASREGAEFIAVPTGALVYGTPWLFGLIVSHRAQTATAIAREAERLAAIDIARLANSAAEQERHRVIDDSISTLRTALTQICKRASNSLEAATDDSIRSIQDAAREAIDRLHATLGALRNSTNTARPIAPLEQHRPGSWRSLRNLRTSITAAIAATALGSICMLAVAPLLGSDWTRPASLVPALLLPPAALLAVRIPIIASLLAAAAMIVAALDAPHPPEVLMPIALPLSSLCWRIAQTDSWQKPWAIGVTVAGATVLSLGHGWDAVGYVIVLITLGVIGGRAWADKDKVMQREEDRAAKLTAQVAAAELGAVREERRRIARELHDVVSHAIATVSLQAQVARIHRSKEPEKSTAALTTVLAIATVTSCELESIADRLQASSVKLDVQKLVEDACHLGLQLAADIDSAAKHDGLAYRIVQEALTNAARYAPGSTISISVSTQDARRRVVVRNGTARGGHVGESTGALSATGGNALTGAGAGAGVGEAPNTGANAPAGFGAAADKDAATIVPAGSGSGLRGLEERVAAVNGRFSAGPAGDGFEVIADWPMDVEVRPAATAEAKAATEPVATAEAAASPIHVAKEG